jgi:acyl carrier protein
MSALRAEEVRHFIMSYLANSFNENNTLERNITDDLDIMKWGIIDSIGLIQLLSAIEEHFNIEIDFSDMHTDDLTVIGPMCKYIEKWAEKRKSDA